MLDHPQGIETLRIRLIATAGKLASNERYTALSHCWGNPSLLTKTTSSNLEAHMDGIDLSDLPPNFKDAVIVTRSLGIQYLWIDSLCIIQDNVIDWATESGRMADIYRSATLTIAGSCSKDSQQGLLSWSRDGFFAEKSILLPAQEGIPEDDKVILQLYRKHFELLSTLEPLQFAIGKHCTEPLGSRAWTLQERLLSRRAIFYDSTQLFWECQSARYLEGWTKNLKQMKVDNRSKRNQLERMRKPTFSNEVSFLGTIWSFGPVRWRHEKPAKYCWWYEMLEDYRMRDLTVATDALPALSGLAKQFATKTGDEYLAGIWRGDFLGGLTWRLKILDEESLLKRYHKHIKRKATGPLSIEECFAPSWSWASIHDSAGRRFRGSSEGGDVLSGHHIDEDRPSPNIPRGFRDRFAKVIEVEVVPRNIDSMGQISSTKLVLEGLCRKVTVKRRKLDIEGHVSSAKLVLESLRKKLTGKRRDLNANRHYGQSPGFFIFEMDGLEPKYLNQYLFPSVDHPPWLEDRLQEAESRGLEYVLTCLFLKSTSGVHCLLLDKAAGQGPIQLYRRCGVVNIEYRLEEFEEGWNMETVSII